VPTKEDMRWFKQTFGEKIEPALQGTPFTLDLLTALACQETGEIWPILRKKNLTTDRILELCVGDSIDARNRRQASGSRRSAAIWISHDVDPSTYVNKVVWVRAAVSGANPAARSTPRSPSATRAVS